MPLQVSDMSATHLAAVHCLRPHGWKGATFIIIITCDAMSSLAIGMIDFPDSAFALGSNDAVVRKNLTPSKQRAMSHAEVFRWRWQMMFSSPSFLKTAF